MAQRTEYKFIIRSLNKDGSVSKAPMGRTERLLKSHNDFEAARKRVQNLKELNPGSRYIIEGNIAHGAHDLPIWSDVRSLTNDERAFLGVPYGPLDI